MRKQSSMDQTHSIILVVFKEHGEFVALVIFRLHILYGKENYSTASVAFLFFFKHVLPI